MAHPYEVLKNITKFLQFSNTRLKVKVIISSVPPKNFFSLIKQFQDLKYLAPS
jgi:hypothetical protein